MINAPMVSQWSFRAEPHNPEVVFEVLDRSGSWVPPGHGVRFYDGVDGVVELPRSDKDSYRYFVGWLSDRTVSLRRVRRSA